jgi:hypothetical protein
MPRATKELELPSLIRATAGHTVYSAGQASICPYHAFCSYTGDEPGICPVCHSWQDEDGGCSHLDYPTGRKRPCFCSRCMELFSSPSSFDLHQRPAGVCRNPEKRGLVLVDSNGWSMWAKPGSPPSREEA